LFANGGNKKYINNHHNETIMETPMMTNASFTMADENIRRIDSYMSHMDLSLTGVIKGDVQALIPTFTSAMTIWNNIENNLERVASELHKQIQTLLNKLDEIIIINQLKSFNQLELRKDMMLLVKLLHKACDYIGIGIVVKVKK